MALKKSERMMELHLNKFLIHVKVANEEKLLHRKN